jgi:hypothetical protein
MSLGNIMQKKQDELSENRHSQGVVEIADIIRCYRFGIFGLCREESREA